jgi:hypothetical protein
MSESGYEEYNMLLGQPHHLLKSTMWRGMHGSTVTQAHIAEYLLAWIKFNHGTRIPPDITTLELLKRETTFRTFVPNVPTAGAQNVHHLYLGYWLPLEDTQNCLMTGTTTGIYYVLEVDTHSTTWQYLRSHSYLTEYKHSVDRGTYTVLQDDTCTHDCVLTQDGTWSGVPYHNRPEYWYK